MFDIYVKIDGCDKKVGCYDNKGSFGELALMYNLPRAATIIATSEGSLWAMDRTTFRRIVLKNAFNKRKMYENLLENVPMLKQLDPYERMNIADALVPKTFEDGDMIIKQGDSADCMYFIESGEVSIMMAQKDSNNEVEVARCTKGQYFGELALVTHKPRAASVYAQGYTKCAVLDIRAFERLLGPCMDILKRNINDYEEQLVQIFGDKANISDLR